MESTEKKQESGQILVVFAIALVGLLGFTALAVDGGMIFSERRLDQSIADSAALAGAAQAAMILENTGTHYRQFTCASSAVQQAMQAAGDAAVERGAMSDYTLDRSHDNENGVVVNCGYEPLGAVYDKYIDVFVKVAKEVNTGFAQMFNPGPYNNTVDAIVRIHPRNTVAFGYAIVSLKDNCSSPIGGMEFSGTSEVRVNGGGIFSNSCITANGGINVVVTPPEEGIGFNNTFTQNGGVGVISPAPANSGGRIPTRIVPAPACSTLPDRGNFSIGNNETATIQPGRYGRIRQTGGSLTLAPGLYCVSNGVSVNGGIINGSGITFYMTGGDFSIAGNVEVNLAAPFGLPEDVSPAIPGMLIYQADGHTGDISMQGNTVSSYLGTVFAPTGSIYAGGTSSTMPTLNTQLVGWNVKVHGTTEIDINFDTSENYSSPSMLDMFK
jgi:Flp pilus assembly protein TadG